MTVHTIAISESQEANRIDVEVFYDALEKLDDSHNDMVSLWGAALQAIDDITVCDVTTAFHITQLDSSDDPSELWGVSNNSGIEFHDGWSTVMTGCTISSESMISHFSRFQNECFGNPKAIITYSCCDCDSYLDDESETGETPNLVSLEGVFCDYNTLSDLSWPGIWEKELPMCCEVPGERYFE